MSQLAEGDHLGLEDVPLQAPVGHHTAYAVLAEPRGLDTQRTQNLQHRAIHIAVTLQLNDDQVVHIHLLSAGKIVEVDATVDGQSLRHAFVHQGDACKMVVQRRSQAVNVVMQVLAQEVALLFVRQVHVVHLDALFLGTLVVVLCLHLHKLQTTDAVGAKTYLLSVRMLPLVHAVHVEVLRVEVCSIILQIARSVDFLHVILITRHFQELLELGHIGNEFRISTVHKLYAAHLV